MKILHTLIIFVLAIFAFAGTGMLSVSSPTTEGEQHVDEWDRDDVCATGMGREIVEPEPEPEPEPEKEPDAGHIWATLIDSTTGQPISYSDCDLWALVTGNDLRPFRARFVPVAKTGGPIRTTLTDADGIADILLPEVEPALDDLSGNLEHVVNRLAVPIPQGWQPVFNPVALAIQIKTENKVDLRFKPMPSIHGRISDREGEPVDGAVVFAWPIEVDPIMQPWAELQSKLFLQQHAVAGSAEGEAGSDALKQWLDTIRNSSYSPLRTKADPDLRSISDIPESWPNEGKIFRQISNNGEYKLTGLFAGKWKIATYFEGQDLRIHELNLSGFDIKKDFNLGVGVRSTHSISVSGTEQPTINFDLHACDPTGVPLPDNVFSWKWQADSPGPQILQLLKTGFWRLFASDGLNKTSVLFQSKPNEAAPIVITFAKGSAGKLEVKLTNGERHADGLFYYYGGGSNEWHSGAVNTDGIDLSAGDYTVWIRGQKPELITVTAGETSTITAQQPMCEINIEVTEAFTALVSGPLELSLIDLSRYQTENKTQKFSIDPALPHAFELAEGVYKWALGGDGFEINGEVLLQSGKPFTFKIDPESLPGLELLRVSCVGYESQQLPDIALLDAFSVVQMLDIRADGKNEMPLRQPSTPASFSRLVTESEILFFAPRGHYRMVIKDASAVVYRSALVPGIATVTSGSTTSTLTAALKVKNSKDFDIRSAALFHEKLGWFEINFAEDANETVVNIPTGSYLLYASIHGDEGPKFGRREIKNRSNGAVIDIAGIYFEEPVKLTIELHGLGNPVLADSNWWHTFGKEPELIRVVHRATGMSMNITMPDEQSLQRGRVRTFNLLLPAGRYLVGIRPYKSRTSTKEVVINSGESELVVFQGS